MLRGLRFRLTILYSLVALGLVALVAGGTYYFLDRYFKRVTDLSLQHKMAYQFRVLGIPMPADLQAADKTWYGTHFTPTLTIRSITPATGPKLSEPDGEQGLDENEESESQPLYEMDDAYDAELTSIFVFPVDENGRLVFNPNTYAPPVLPNLDAIKSARANGSDWRTVYQADGTPVRLLTYTLPPMDGPALLQMGRSLGDQARILRLLMTGLLIFNGLIIMVMGLGSWHLAGRTLRPAQIAWEQQQIFIANASHELRAPLTLIQASAEVALRKEADTGQKELLSDLLDECGHMGKLVEDLLLLSRIDSHRVKMETRELDLKEILEDLQRMAVRLGLKRQTQVVFDPAEGKIFADPTRLRQVLLIVLDNAIRHNPPGGSVHVTASIRGKLARISVSDSGKGIAPEHQTHVFERFYQVENSRSTLDRGNGLGLPIAKGLIEAQGGVISLESQPGAGTTVTISIPAV